MRTLGTVLFACLCLSIAAFGQGYGTINGTVSDPSGAVVAGAQVTITDVATGISRSAVADAHGGYVMAALRPADYSISAEATGFRKFVQPRVTLLANQSLTYDVRLTLGGATETVEVTGQEQQVDTTTSTVRQTVEGRRITELPLNGRNAAQLTLLVPGAVTSTSGGADQGDTKTFPGAVTISANGARQNQISYQLDGGNYVDEYTNVNQPFPFPDALQEFSVQTSNYSAEYGQNAGAVVNIVTKSGTNAFHGNVFEFVRNEVFNAKAFQATTRDHLKRNQFGGTFGGPIIRDKTFFFAGYQGLRHRNVGSTNTTVVPSAAQRATATDPAISNLLKGIPVGDATGRASFTKPDSRNFNEVIGKVDHVIGKDDRFTARYTYNRFSKVASFDPSNFLSYADGSKITAQNILLSETHLFTPNLVSAARFSYSRDAASRGPSPNAINVADLGVALPFQPIKAIQQIRVNGAFNFGDNPSASFIRNNFTWAEDVSWVHGKHDFRFGGIVERSRVDLDNRFFQPAEFSFNSIADLLVGKMGSFGGNPAFRQGAGEFKANRDTFMGFYVQDNYKVHRRLTLNLGMRWEPGRPWREMKNRWTRFTLADFAAGRRSTVFPNAPAGLTFPGDEGFPENGLRDSWNNFAPRVGFAWDVMGNGTTSLRGGAGIFYNSRIDGIVNNRFVDSTPFSPQLIMQAGDITPGSFSDPLCTSAATQARLGCSNVSSLYPFPAILPPPKNASFRPGDLYLTWDPNHDHWQVPTVYNWNLIVERQLPANMIAHLGYVGSRSTHLPETLNLDPFPVGGAAFRRLNILSGNKLIYGDLQQVNYDTNSTYHSLQASAERRMSRGLTVSGAYTWAKSIDDVPPGAGVAGFDTTYSARPWDDPLRHAFDRGPSEFDHTHRFAGSYVYLLPVLEHSNGILKTLLGGWQLSGVISTQTGRPATLLSSLGGSNSSTSGSGTGLGQDRAVFLGSTPAYGPGACATATKPCRNWLNPAAFAQNTPGTFGNVGKGQFRYPGNFIWDAGLHKDFVITERVHLQFRAEFFNVINTVIWDEDQATGNFAKKGSGSGNGNFGALTTEGDGISKPGPRIGQLALKLSF
jgi:hypothetical protein